MPQSYRQYLKICAVKNFSCNTFLVDVALAVCELLQKPCSNVNISASVVPKVFFSRKNINYLSGATFSRYFFCQISCAHKQQVEASKNIRAMFIA